MATRAAEPSPDKGDDKGPSGRLLLRMPRTLHAELAQVAEKRGVSLNQLIVGLLAGSVSQGEAVHGVSQAAAQPDARTQRRLSIALTVNLVVLVLVAAVAIALLIVALTGGF